MIKLTLNDIKAKSPCKDGWENLLKSLDKTRADDTEVTFSYIAENNDVSDSLWCLRCIDVRKHKKEIALLCADIAESVLHIYEKKYPNYTRVRDCIQAIRDFTEGKITIDELRSKRVCADAAAADAYTDADAYADADADYAAYAADAAANAANAAYAAYAAAYAANAGNAGNADAANADAADAAAYAANAADAAYAADAAANAGNADAADAERTKQIKLIKKHLG